MSHSSIDRLVYTANQLDDFFKYQPHQDTAEAIAEHIRKYWDPRMRQQIFAHLDAGGEGLNPATKHAIEILRAQAEAAARQVCEPSGG